MYKNTPAVDEKYSFIRMLNVTSKDFEVTRFSWALYPRPARRRGLTALLLTESVTQPISYSIFIETPDFIREFTVYLLY